MYADLLLAARTPTQPQARQQAPATSRAPGYGDNDTTRDSTGISAADMRNPQYSYMSSVYGGNTVDPRVDGDRANRSPARGAAAPSADRANRSPAGYVAAPSGDTANRSPTGYAAASSSEYIAKRERALSRGKEQGPVDNVDNYRGRHSPQSSAFNDASAGRQSQSDDTPSRRRSIPRKQVGSGAYSPPSLPSQTFPSSTTSSPSHARQSSVRDKPLPSTPPGTTGRAQNSGYADNRPAQPKLGEQRMLVEGAREKPSLEGVVDLSNTKDTMVIEKIAPGMFSSFVRFQGTWSNLYFG